MTRLLLIVLAVCVLAACTPAAPAGPPPDPLSIVQSAAQSIRAAQTFRLIVDQTGPDYVMMTDFGDVNLRRAEAVYVSPDVMQSAISVTALGGLRVDIEVFARAAEQWFRSPVWTANTWINAQFAPGFNPAALIAEDTGFNAALGAVIDLSYVEVTTLEDGQRVHQLSGRAAAEGVNALLIGLIVMYGEVGVDIYVNTETGFPARFVLLETIAGEEDRTWTLDIYDVNEPADIDDPQAAAPADGNPAAPAPAATDETAPGFIGVPGG